MLHTIPSTLSPPSCGLARAMITSSPRHVAFNLRRYGVRASLESQGDSTTMAAYRQQRSSTMVAAAPLPQQEEAPFTMPKLPFSFKLNDLLAGRMAMFGFAAALVTELMTGQGPVSLMGFQTDVSTIFEVDAAILLVVGFNLVAGLLPIRLRNGGESGSDDDGGAAAAGAGSRRGGSAGAAAGGRAVAEPQRLVAEVQQAPVAVFINSKRYFGVSESELQDESDIALARLVQLGFSAALIWEAMTGKGLLAQVGVETGLPLNQADPLVLIFLTFVLLCAISPGCKRHKYRRRN